MIRAFLLDDSRFCLEACAARMAAESDFQVAGAATDTESGLPLIREAEPDLIVTDVRLPGRGAFACAAEILRYHRTARVVFLTDCLSDVFIDAAVRVGASGYLLKEESFPSVLGHLRRVVRGERRFSPRVLQRLEHDARHGWLQTRCGACLSALNHQHLEIVRHLARGDSVKEVAVKLDMSPRTVEGLKYRIMQQLGLHDRVSLARFAIREGLTLP